MTPVSNRKNFSHLKDRDRKCYGENSSIHSDSTPEYGDSSSLVSSSGGGTRRLVSRSDVICSSGADKYTYDGENATDHPIYLTDINDVDTFSTDSVVTSFCATPTSDRISLCSQGSTLSSRNLVKRETVVHPGLNISHSVFVNGRFENPWPSYRRPSMLETLKWSFVTKDNTNVPHKKELEFTLPVLTPDKERLENPPDDGVQLTWLGHACVLVQFDGICVITDPMFSDRASPLQLIGPKRYRDPPCTVMDLPKVDAVLISHNHYDHLDINSVSYLNARFGCDIRWFVPLGLQTWMEEVGCKNVVQLDWWEENCIADHANVSFVFTPAQHWSKRTPTDDNKSLWGSWAVIGAGYKFFYAGDTGYCPAFKEIGQLYGPFDLAALPIGSYEPRWMMKYNHIDPEDAVKIHEDLKAYNSVGIHWGTFARANEYYLEPPRKLKESLDKRGIPHNKFFTMKHGETKVIRNRNFKVKKS